MLFTTSPKTDRACRGVFRFFIVVSINILFSSLVSVPFVFIFTLTFFCDCEFPLNPVKYLWGFVENFNFFFIPLISEYIVPSILSTGDGMNFCGEMLREIARNKIVKVYFDGANLPVSVILLLADIIS